MLTGPSLQEDIIASGPTVNTSLVFSSGQQPTGFSIAIALNLTDDDYALEAIEMYQLTLIIPQTTKGVVSGEPITTTINILDNDSMCEVHCKHVQSHDPIILIYNMNKLVLGCHTASGMHAT